MAIPIPFFQLYYHFIQRKSKDTRTYLLCLFHLYRGSVSRSGGYGMSFNAISGLIILISRAKEYYFPASCPGVGEMKQQKGGGPVKKIIGVLAVSIGMVAVASAEVIVDVSDAFTAGKFTYGDSTIKVKSSAANPRGSLEYHFIDTPFAIGVEYASSENDFEGEYEDSDGELSMERTEYAAYIRLGGKNSTNLRLGYRNFEYDITEGDIRQSSGEHDINGIANGKMATGIDAELNLLFGEKVTFGVGIGYTFFTGAEYTWEYDIVGGGHQAGSAELDAHSLRIRPEISFETMENLRIYVNVMLAATAWEGTPDNGKDYPGFDIYSAAAVGLRYSFGQ